MKTRGGREHSARFATRSNISAAAGLAGRLRLAFVSNIAYGPLPGSHPAATRPANQPLRLADVAADPLVIFPRQIAPSLFDAVLSAGIGVAWVPESVTRLQRPGVVHRAVPDAGLHCQTRRVWRELAAPVVVRFVDQVRAQVKAQVKA